MTRYIPAKKRGVEGDAPIFWAEVGLWIPHNGFFYFFICAMFLLNFSRLTILCGSVNILLHSCRCVNRLECFYNYLVLRFCSLLYCDVNNFTVLLFCFTHINCLPLINYTLLFIMYNLKNSTAVLSCTELCCAALSCAVLHCTVL